MAHLTLPYWRYVTGIMIFFQCPCVAKFAGRMLVLQIKSYKIDDYNKFRCILNKGKQSIQPTFELSRA